MVPGDLSFSFVFLAFHFVFLVFLIIFLIVEPSQKNPIHGREYRLNRLDAFL